LTIAHPQTSETINLWLTAEVMAAPISQRMAFASSLDWLGIDIRKRYGHGENPYS
jgi:hypothetical protein